MTSSESGRESLIDATGAREVTISAGGSTTSALSSREGEHLVLFHGFNAAASLVWWPVIPALSKDFKMVAPDFAGLSESEALQGPPDTSHVVEWLKGVIGNCCGDRRRRPSPLFGTTRTVRGRGPRTYAANLKPPHHGVF